MSIPLARRDMAVVECGFISIIPRATTHLIVGFYRNIAKKTGTLSLSPSR
jgi:hypothetical protein